MSEAFDKVLSEKQELPQEKRRIEMTYEIVQDKKFESDWRVEAINTEGDGECYVTIFSGPDAEIRAREYATWKTVR